MRRDEAIKDILTLLNEDDLTICANGKITREAYLHNDRKGNFYTLASMGKASSIGLGVALCTNQKVIILDGDGNILMNLDNLALIGYIKPKN